MNDLITYWNGIVRFGAKEANVRRCLANILRLRPKFERRIILSHYYGRRIYSC